MRYPPARRCVIRKVLLSMSVGLFFVAACTRGGSNATPPLPTANPELAMREVTEPWKSMNLPIDGAVVIASDSDGALFRYPSIQGDAFGSVHAAMVEALQGLGWQEMDVRDLPSVKSSILKNEDSLLEVSTVLDNGRPQVGLTKM